METPVSAGKCPKGPYRFNSNNNNKKKEEEEAIEDTDPSSSSSSDQDYIEDEEEEIEEDNNDNNDNNKNNKRRHRKEEGSTSKRSPSLKEENEELRKQLEEMQKKINQLLTGTLQLPKVPGHSKDPKKILLDHMKSIIRNNEIIPYKAGPGTSESTKTKIILKHNKNMDQFTCFGDKGYLHNYKEKLQQIDLKEEEVNEAYEEFKKENFLIKYYNLKKEAGKNRYTNAQIFAIIVIVLQNLYLSPFYTLGRKGKNRDVPKPQRMIAVKYLTASNKTPSFSILDCPYLDQLIKDNTDPEDYKRYQKDLRIVWSAPILYYGNQTVLDMDLIADHLYDILNAMYDIYHILSRLNGKKVISNSSKG